jgi:hypothetical protein
MSACQFGFGACDRADGLRPYAEGLRCPDHTPAKLAGRPEPDTARYCLAVCYCGRCLHRRHVPLTPITATIKDHRDIASGKRRPRSIEEYRDAQAQVRGR